MQRLHAQMREGEAPSFFNAQEAALLVELVEGLIAQTNAGGRAGVRPDDLGIIATYRKQVLAWPARTGHCGGAAG